MRRARVITSYSIHYTKLYEGRGLAEVDEEVDKVARGAVVLDRALLALELPQRVRHGDVRKGLVVPARGRLVVPIEGAQVGVV